jgi:hypothetical protein
MRGDKPIAGSQDVEISGRLDTEIPVFHGMKSLHGFLLNPSACRWSQPPFAAQIFGRIIVLRLATLAEDDDKNRQRKEQATARAKANTEILASPE